MSANKFLSTITKLGVLSIGSIHLMNRWISSSIVSEKKLLYSRSDRYYDWTFGQVYYTVTGTGSRPLLLIHDASVVSSGADWDRLIPYLSDKYKIYTLDLPGCGRSAKPAITYTNYLYVRLIQSFINDVIHADVDIAASSLSSSFVFMAAAFDHARIHRIFAINPPSFGELCSSVTKYGRTLQTVMSLPVIGTFIYHMVTNRRNIEFNYAEKSYYNPFHLSKVKIEKSYVASHLAAGSGRYLLSSLQGRYVHLDIRHALPKIDIPVTIIMGDKVPGSRKTALSYKKLNNAFEIKTVLQSKLLPQEENPAMTASFMQ